MALSTPSFRTPLSIAAEAELARREKISRAALRSIEQEAKAESLYERIVRDGNCPLPDAPEAARNFWDTWHRGQIEREVQAPEPDPIKLGLIARTLQAETDRDHMLERLRDLATMARDDTDPYLELEVFRLQAEINAPLLGTAA